MASGHKTGAARATEDRSLMLSQLSQAEKVDPFVQRTRDYLGNILDWAEGKQGPMDVRNFPDQVDISLYEDAKKAHDEGRIGRGVGSMSGNVNPNFIAALNKEQDLTRSMRASGALEQAVEGKAGAARQAAYGVGTAEEDRQARLLQALSGIYGTDIRYAYQPSFLEQLALQSSSGAGAAAIGLLSDERLKENIQPVADKLERLDGVTWDWKPEAQEVSPDAHGSSTGLIAQDVEREFPDLVTEHRGYKHINANALAAMAIEALKEERRKKAA